MSKTDKLKPLLIESVARLARLIQVDAPGVIIGAAAWHTYTTVLATYGSGAGSTMINDLRDGALHGRGICSHEDCTVYVERPSCGMCAKCLKEIGADDETLTAMFDGMEPEVQPK